MRDFNMSPFCPRLPTMWDFQHTPLARNDHNLGGFSNILPYAQDYPLVARQTQESHQIGSDFIFFISKNKYINKSTRGTMLQRSKNHQSPGSPIRLYAVSIGTRDWVRIHIVVATNNSICLSYPTTE